MTALEEKLTAAFRARADQIEPGSAPPLRLSAGGDRSRSAARASRSKRAQQRPGLPRWLPPAVGVAAVAAVIVASLALSGAWRGNQTLTGRQAAAAAAAAGLPPYYVALTARGANALGPLFATAATVRTTATGAVVAQITPPRPYTVFAGVTAAADGHTFVLAVARYVRCRPGRRSSCARNRPALVVHSRFYLLHIDPVNRSVNGRMRLTPMPTWYVPTGLQVLAMDLSPNGKTLAAIIGYTDRLTVFQLGTDRQRSWFYRVCHENQCGPGYLGFGLAGIPFGSLSWQADGRTLAVDTATATSRELRLLDTTAQGMQLAAASRVAITVPRRLWREGIITPDGRAVIAVLQVGAQGEQVVKYSAATGRATVVVNSLSGVGGLTGSALVAYEQVVWTSPTGRAMVITDSRPGFTAGIMNGRHYTPLPWSSDILSAAW